MTKKLYLAGGIMVAVIGLGLGVAHGSEGTTPQAEPEIQAQVQTAPESQPTPVTPSSLNIQAESFGAPTVTQPASQAEQAPAGEQPEPTAEQPIETPEVVTPPQPKPSYGSVSTVEL